MEEARKLLMELEALKQQVLQRYPEAASSDSFSTRQAEMSNYDGLPGQVQEGVTGAPETRSAAARPHTNTAVVQAVQQELSRQTDTLRTQLWRELVREELMRLTGSRSTVPATIEPVDNGDNTSHHPSHHSEEHHKDGSEESHEEKSGQHHHRHHKRGLYTNDFVYGNTSSTPLTARSGGPLSSRSHQHSHRAHRHPSHDAEATLADAEGTDKKRVSVVREGGEGEVAALGSSEGKI